MLINNCACMRVHACACARACVCLCVQKNKHIKKNMLHKDRKLTLPFQHANVRGILFSLPEGTFT